MQLSNGTDNTQLAKDPVKVLFDVVNHGVSW